MTIVLRRNIRPSLDGLKEFRRRKNDILSVFFDEQLVFLSAIKSNFLAINPFDKYEYFSHSAAEFDSNFYRKVKQNV